jgi:hypothetical protein
VLLIYKLLHIFKLWVWWTPREINYSW